MRSGSLLAALARRDRLVIASCILLVTALAWGYLVNLHQRMPPSAGSDATMAEMGMPMNAPWGTSDVVFTFLMWAVMMVGMMSAPATPVLLLYADMQARRAERGLPIAVLSFGIGYVALWLAFSAVAAIAQWALHDAALLSDELSVASRGVGGAILIVAGLYQLTPAKSACLRHCQSPMGFLLSSWRDGASGALRMGLRHGSYCLGCCWVLMCVLFTVGVMNLAWVAALTAFILLEKSGLGGPAVTRVGGLAMIVAGTGVAMR